MFKGNHLVISSSSVPTVAGAKHHHPLAPYLAHLETLQLEPAPSKVAVQSKANWDLETICLMFDQFGTTRCVNMRTLRRSTYPCLSQTSSAVAFTCIYNNSAQLYHAFIWCLCVSSTPIVINEPFKHCSVLKNWRPASWSIMLEHQRPVWLHQRLHSFWPFTSKIERSRSRIPRIHRKTS